MHRPGLTCIILGVTLMLGGILGGVYSGWVAYQGMPAEVLFFGPGHATIQAGRMGSYFVWNDYQTVFQGESHNDSKSLPAGWNFSVTQDATGRVLELKPLLDMSVQVNASASTSIGSVEVAQPGNYTLTVTGTDPRRVFSIGYSPFKMMGEVIASVAPVLLLGMLPGFIILIVGLVRISRPVKPRKDLL